MGKEMFDNIPSKVIDLLMDVKNGRIGLPDLQRPFVWKDSKIRDLLDSMLKGYPIGYIMLWESPTDYENAGHIGRNEKMYRQPDELVIDGQQRLTALLAAILGIPVKNKDYRERNVRISFQPLTREFAVWSQAYERDPMWISAISSAFAADQEHAISKYRKAYIKGVNEARARNDLPKLTDDEEDTIESNINDLLNLNIYSLPTLRISAKADEEDVADIFVRVNSGGQNLTEKNFIETLLAVYDNEVHDKINLFCEQCRIPAEHTSYNPILAADPSHIIRMTVGIGFRRARLRYAYMLLRGKDLRTGEVTQKTRETNLALFKNSLDTVTNLNNWHSFMNLFVGAGYTKGNIIASTNAVVYSYVLYLIGKYKYKVSAIDLQRVMRKWIFMSTITGFYTGSTESEVEKQFADLRAIHTATEFVSYLDERIAMHFTEDYFSKTLPNALNNSAAISPAWFGYVAAINILGTPTLFGTTPQSHYFAIGASGDKKAIDKHHIFPKHYLEEHGFPDDRDRNQIANFAYLDYTTNIDISDDDPIVYAHRYKEKLGMERYRLACEQNALPDGFESMEYMEFLGKRRILMANLIHKAFNELSK